MRKFLIAHFEDERETPEPAHRKRILELTQKAGCYGLTTEQQVAGYIVISKVHGGNFDQETGAREILNDPSLDGDEKIEKLVPQGNGHQIP
ncbi:MAG: hypothetical protein EOP87_00520 [Verrucomicrobiaceae bacterium]|nr:MAG: hypothetical protein EOP87_00520 [Verrucomicrobiaceae bacterium]